MKHKKRALFQSVLALILCLSMLVGTTFAWFTDSVTSGSNIIQAGNLDIGMEFTGDLKPADGSDPVWTDASSGAIFNYENWEPGYTDLKYLRITNEGNLAFQYQLTFDLPDTTTGTVMDGGEPGSSGVAGGIAGSEGGDISNVGNSGDITAEGGVLSLTAEEGTGTENGTTSEGGTPSADALKLAEAIDVYYLNATNAPFATREEAMEKLVRVGTLSDLLHNRLAAATGVLLPEESLFSKNAELPATLNPDTGSTTACIMLKMREDAGNEYMDCSAGGGFCVKVLATQYAYEEDAFGSDYDTKAAEDIFPAFTGTMGGTGSVTTNNGVTTEEVTIGGAKIPAGVQVTEGTKELTVSITEKSGSDANVQLRENEAMRSLDVHIEGVSADNTVPIIVDLGKVLAEGFNQGNVTLYHVENGAAVEMTQVKSLSELDAHNEFYYDPATGNTTVAMARFSEVALVADMENAWNGTVAERFSGGSGNETDPYIIANADQLAYLGDQVSNDNGKFGSAYYKLIADVNMGGEKVVDENGKLKFYPIGYTSEGYKGAFSGTFDGAGHKISNIFQNTWMLVGTYDGTYYNAAMGLFGYVNGGTVKNLTVDNFSSDGEFAPTGVIAAFADGNSTFENIAITNCNPRVYNTGNGGIIGIAGDTSAANDDHITLKNITVDNSNKISALWGSYDVACGGLVGMYRGNVDGSGNATGDTISFNNCHVAAQMDVYNDVCGNYQYYAYRYAGMIIGSVRHNTTNDDGKTIPNMEGISASGCTVNYGDWNDYYYCEFEKNGNPSYCDKEQDFKFSRVPDSELTTENGVVKCTHSHSDVENNRAIYLPFHQLFTGYSWGVSSIGLKEYSGIVTDLGITEGDQQESVVKFETKFTGDFLYRVGNQNAVSVGNLFAAIDEDKISYSGVQVTIDKVDENANVSGTFTANTTDWTKGTIQFTGTGLVKVTIQDYNFCKPTELIVEVIDATNLTSATGTTTGGTFVLVSDVNTSTYVNYWNCTLYGNGFTYSLKDAPTAYNSKQGHGILITKSATLDNLKIIGDVYNSYGAYSNQDYYNTAVDAAGDTVIQNCYIANCAAPVRARSNVTITNTTLYGGTVANLLIMSGTATLEDVTTANYDDGRKIIGMGIVIHSDATESTKLVLNGTLTQYNFISESKVPTDTYAKNLHNAMFSSSCSQYHFGTSPNRQVNTGIISLTTKFNNTNIIDNANTTYVGQSVSASGFNGYVYTQPNTSGSVNNNSGEYKPTTQGAVPPEYSFDHSVNYKAETCYEENGTVYISMSEGSSFDWITSILSVTKLGKNLDYTVSMNGVDYTKKSITFNAAGDYTVVYSYTDSDNFAVDKDGNVTKYSKTYTQSVHINVATVKAAWKDAEIQIEKTAMSGIYVMSGDYDYSYKMKFLDCVTVTDYDEAGNVTAVDLSKNVKSTSFVDKNSANPGKFDANSGTVTITYNDGKILTVKIGAWSGSGPSTKTCSVKTDDSIYLITDGASNAANTGVTWKITGYTYTGNNGKLVSKEETITFTWDTNSEGYNSKDSGCVTPDTLVTLANGKQVRVDSLTGSEELLVWNLETGKLDSAPIMFVDSDPTAAYEIVHLYFSDGTDVKVIYEHGFWDYDLNKYVYLDANAADYIGHTFAKHNGNQLTKVKLTDVVIETETTTAWSPVTAGHLCYFVNGMLSMPGGVGGLFNIFDVVPETMTYDFEAMARDIETYGLFTYDELNSIAPLSEEMFNAAGGAYLKVSIGKGNLTMDELINMINRYSKFFE